MYKIFTKQLEISKWYILKLLLIMRLTTAIILLTMLQVSAASYSQNITYIKKDATLIQLFKEIKAQTGYNVVWSEESIDPTTRIDVNFRNTPLQEALDRSFKSLPLAYVINDKTIVIKEKTPSFRNKIVDYFTAIDVTGAVYDDKGNPLSGATVKLEGTNIVVRTNDKGSFTLNSKADNGVLIISFLGYKTEKVSFSPGKPEPFNIVLKQEENGLLEIEIVSTGYQDIPKERATGSFTVIDNEFLNRSVSTNILDRLDGVTSGLIFNKNLPGGGNSNGAGISIRGRSTLFANPNPLIILDNFPYEGNINNINPNDIESFTILKDAAAASIWGVRAGNGVIVMTSKKGKTRNKVQLTANVTSSFSNRPSLRYKPQMSVSEYIDLEQYLYQKGHYNRNLRNNYSIISPAVAIMLQKKNGQISAADSSAMIADLKRLDARDDLEKYIYRPAINQQYAFSLDGGNSYNKYYLSAGYNKDIQNLKGNSYERFTLNANHSFILLKDKLELSAGVLLSTDNTKGNTSRYTTPYTPYDKLADETGNPLSVVREGGLRKQYTDTAGKGKLLNWDYKPLDENYSNQITKLTDYKLNANLKYAVFAGLSFALNYQYQKGISDYSQQYADDSFFTRNLINSFTQLNQTTLIATRPIPLGGINNTAFSNYYSNYGRTQINYTANFNNKHEINALAGVEIKDYKSINNSNRMYGYNLSNGANIPVDYLNNFKQYYGNGTIRIPYSSSSSYSIDRFRSAFFNASYYYDNRYGISASARRDESNIFGVKTNQKGVPLWSAGLMWNLSNEHFYSIEKLPKLTLRATYGYNGNLDRSTSAYLTARTWGSSETWNVPYSEIINPPNPSLRWERIKNINFGLDFSTKENLFAGSVDYFIKRGIDLIGNSPIAPQSGITQFKGNTANTKTTGIDVVINKNSIGRAKFKWQSNFLFSYNKETVTNYKVKQGSNLDVVNSNFANPLEGYPYYALFSFKFVGLNEQGKPKGILNNSVSQDYANIINSNDASELVYNGSAIPLLYGSFRNSFQYADFDLSLNITYKLKYWYRRYNVFSGSNYSYTNADYDKRWQKAGDELKTIIPALSYPVDFTQDAFFQGSDALVEKADHIRLQDIRLSYTFSGIKALQSFKNLRVYCYINNLGIIWKATKQPLDPDAPASSFINPRSYSIGLSTNF